LKVSKTKSFRNVKSLLNIEGPFLFPAIYNIFTKKKKKPEKKKKENLLDRRVEAWCQGFRQKILHKNKIRMKNFLPEPGGR
jgi:hypothetical protein